MATGLFNLKQVNQAISQGAWSGYIAPKWVEYLVVAGGGSGGGNGGGGGAGGLLTGIVTVAAGTSYTVTVGAGGTGGVYPTQANGNNSVFGSISATAGGKGGGDSSSYPAGSGGSGGGSGYYASIGQGTSGQGNAGGAQNGLNSGGGGGGAGTVGLNGASTTVGGNGGAGIASAITGTVVTYAGGGAGWANTPGTGGTGGVGGGGSAGAYQGVAGSGGGNTGGGGAGSAGGSGTSGSGGSGIVVVRYPGSVQFFTGGTLSYANGYMIHTFYASGTLAPTTPTPYVTDYQISRSLRFNSADTTYLNRTPASATNRKTWTLSLWLKRSELGKQSYLFGATSDSYNANFTLCSIAASDQLYLRDFSASAERFYLQTSAVLRDVSAWYHILVSVDTTQATSSNRVKLYINNVEQSLGTATYPSQNIDTFVDSTNPHTIGVGSSNTTGGYMTEVNFIDGQALTPSSFGYTNSATGVWSPLAFVGTYGTNGFELNFSDNSNTTAATLGKDYSGNGNNWTPNNFSVTAGAGNDSLVDSPTSYGTDTGVGGTVRGNYCTISPLYAGATGISNGNLDVVPAGSTQYGTISLTTGKWYWEVTPTASLVGSYLGVMDSTFIKTDGTWNQNVAATYVDNGSKYGGGGAGSYGASYTTGDVIGFALDLDAGTMVFYKNGASQGVAFTDMAGRQWRAMIYATGGTYACNFGQRPFAYTAPSGFKALCTQNLPTPTIGATTATLASQFFAPVTYTGTSATQSVTVGFQPDFVWIKNRTSALAHYLNDSVRGPYQTLFSNLTSAEYNGTSNSDGVSTFNSNSFTLLNGTNAVNYNASSNNYVAWNWKANGSGSTNTAGTITSTVSANTTSGFSVVTYTGNGTSGATVGHGLGITPSMVILKSRSGGTYDWRVYHSGLTAGYNIALNSTAAQYQGSSGNAGYISAVASTTYTLTQSGANVLDAVNASGGTYVAYCFAEVAGYSKFGTYTGNGSTDGPFVYCGFRPAYVMFKRTDVANDWVINDATRSAYNQTINVLYANDSAAENTTGAGNSIDILSNGFKLRQTNNGSNASGGTYIFMAFASAPQKFALAR